MNFKPNKAITGSGSELSIEGFKSTSVATFEFHICSAESTSDVTFIEECNSQPFNCLTHCWSIQADAENDVCMPKIEDLKIVECMSDTISIEFDPCLGENFDHIF